MKRTIAAVAMTIGVMMLSAGCGNATATQSNGNAVAAHAAVPTQIAVNATSFKFAPSVINLKAGQPVTLVITNADTIDHDLKSDIAVSDFSYGKADNDPDEQKENVQKGVFDIDFNAGSTSTVTFTPAKAGTFAFHCDVSGHAEMGMTGTFVVS